MKTTVAHSPPIPDPSRPEVSDLVASYMAFLRTADSLRASLEQQLTVVGVSWARYEILRHLEAHGPVTYTALSRSLLRHRTSIGVTTGALASAGYVAVQQNPAKRQQHLLCITHRGSRLLQRADRALSAIPPRRLDARALNIALELAKQL